MTDPLAELEAKARAQVAAVADDPLARLALRQTFYASYGFGTPLLPSGYGDSEIAFLQWEIRRGVLNPVGDHPGAGSAWWRAVNAALLYDSQLARLVYEARIEAPDVSHEVKAWLAYIARPSPESWYAAHDASIVRGYLAHTAEAFAETPQERLFMNEVLYRLLFAEALAAGWAAGELGDVLADPRLWSVDLVTRMTALYPVHYPLTPDDVLDIEHIGRDPADGLARVLDLDLILPHIAELYALVARTIGEPELDRAIKDGIPIYPELTGGTLQRLAALRASLARRVEGAASAVERLSAAPPAPPAPPPPPPPKKKIAILGAGMSALAAAHELTSYAGWNDAYDVTIYQLGWRVGGKTATGRGPHERIEEHGIHILQGWYDNTFRLIEDVYRERRDRHLAPESPFQRWQDALVPDSATLLTEWLPGRGWVNWPLVFTTNDAVPGQGPPLSIWELAKKGVAIALETLLGSPYQEGQSPLVKWILDHFFPPSEPAPEDATSRPSWWHTVNAKIETALRDRAAPVQLQRLHFARELLGDLEPGPGHSNDAHPVEVVIGLLRQGIEWVEHVAGSHLREREMDGLRRALLLIDLACANLEGLAEDVWDPATRTFDFARVNGDDYREWIRKHGASDAAADSVIVRFIYTGTFSNLTDGRDRGGRIAAGSALHFVLQSIGYKGAFVWKFKAGTGDTMIMPIYEVLAARGVRFELFRQVEDLVPGPGATIDAITLGEQVTLKVPEYEPTFRVGNVRAWPSHPLYDQIDPAQAAELQAKGVDLEEPWADWTNPVTRTLRKGTDFDEVILAIPVAALPACCSKIIGAKQSWSDMVARVATTQTQAMQLWLSKDLPGLGMNMSEWGMAKDCAPNTVVYANPMYSWIDMSLVLPYERWPAGEEPKLLVYYTGPLADAAVVPPFSDHAFPQQQHARVTEIAQQWLQDNMGWFWPGGTALEAPQGLDLSLLVDGVLASSPSNRFENQYFRANVAPWQRFTLAVPGTEKYRLGTSASGYENLFLTGDWIDYGMNVGYIEGAVVSGIQAGQAVRSACGKRERRPLLLSPDLARRVRW